jgi:hypothetical protein
MGVRGTLKKGRYREGCTITEENKAAARERNKKRISRRRSKEARAREARIRKELGRKEYNEKRGGHNKDPELHKGPPKEKKIRTLDALEAFLEEEEE